MNSGFFGLLFDMDNDGHLDDSERFMDSYAAFEMMEEMEEEDEAEPDD